MDPSRSRMHQVTVKLAKTSLSMEIAMKIPLRWAMMPGVTQKLRPLMINLTSHEFNLI